MRNNGLFMCPKYPALLIAVFAALTLLCSCAPSAGVIPPEEPSAAIEPSAPQETPEMPETPKPSGIAVPQNSVAVTIPIQGAEYPPPGQQRVFPVSIEDKPVLAALTLEDGTELCWYDDGDAVCAAYKRPGGDFVCFLSENVPYRDGFGFGTYENLFGHSGFYITAPRGAAYGAVDYYYFGESGEPVPLFAGAEITAVGDFNGDGENELIVFYHGGYDTSYYYAQNGKINHFELTEELEAHLTEWRDFNCVPIEDAWDGGRLFLEYRTADDAEGADFRRTEMEFTPESLIVYGYPDAGTTKLSVPPKLPETERKALNPPYLVKLQPYLGGSYTDGFNTFIVREDGTVLCSLPYKYARAAEWDKREHFDTPSRYGITHSDEYERITKIAEEHGYAPYFDFVHKDGDTYYLATRPMGGGSGEAYYAVKLAKLLRISTDGELFDYGLEGVVHAVIYGGHIYYVDLIDGVFGTPGIGKIVRTDMDGTDKETIVDDPVYGTFQIVRDRIFYTSLIDTRAYSTDLSGGDKKPVGDRIAPDRHRIGLEFFDDMIISSYWQNNGYSFGIFVTPSEEVTPAIMDAGGGDLITFPPELCGKNPYEVVNWGKLSGEYDSDSFLILKSNTDDSYWVYCKGSNAELFDGIYDDAYDEYLEKMGG